MLKKISARHFDLTNEMKEKAEAELDALTRYFENIISAEFVLDMEKHRRIAELNVKVYNIYNCMAQAVDKVKSQLKKYKGKLKDKKQDKISETKDMLTKPTTDDDEFE